MKWGKKEGDYGTVFVEIKLPGAASGDYNLVLTAEDTVSGTVSRTSRDVRFGE